MINGMVTDISGTVTVGTADDLTAPTKEDKGMVASLTIKLAKPVKVKSVVIEHPLNGVTSFILALLFETFEFHQVGC